MAIDNGEGNNAVGDVFGVVIFDAAGNEIYSANAAGAAGVLTSLGGVKLGGGNVQFHGCK